MSLISVDRARRHLIVVLAVLLCLALGCSVETAEFGDSAAAESEDPIATDSSDETDTAIESSSDPLAPDSENSDGAGPDELAFVDGGLSESTSEPSGLVDEDDGQGSSDSAPLAATQPGDVGAEESSPASSAEPDPDGESPAEPNGYSSGVLDGDATGAPNGLLGPSATASADSTGSADPDEIAEAAARGAVLIEAFGLPGARLLSDDHRRCVLGEFEAVSGSTRTDQIIASLAPEQPDVDVVVNSLVVCDSLAYIESGLNESLDSVLEDSMAEEVASCLADTYSAPSELAALMKLALADAQTASDATRQDGLGSVVVCAGLGDLVAADALGLSDAARVCLNNVGGDVMTALLNSEVRSAPVGLNATEVGSLLTSCLTEPELTASAD